MTGWIRGWLYETDIRPGAPALLTAVLLLALAVVPCAAVEERKVLRVAFPQTKGYSMTAEDGRRF